MISQFFQTVCSFSILQWVVSVTAAVLLKLLFNKYGRSIKSIPGPFAAGFTDLWRFSFHAFDSPHDTLLELHRSFSSPLVRIGPRAVSVGDPRLIPLIYGSHSGFMKTEFYTLMMLPCEGQFTPSLFTTSDESYHDLYKRPIAQAYSMTTIRSYETLVDKTTALLMERLNAYCEPGAELDLGKWLHVYAFDVICEIIFSKSLGFLTSGEDVNGIMADIRTKVFLGGCIGQVPACDKFITRNPFLLALAPTHPIVKFTNERIQDRQKMDSELQNNNPDFLARCYEAKAKEPELVSDRTIRMYNVDNVAAGSDTTAITLRSIFYYLMKTPHSMHRLLGEIDDANAGGKLSTFITFQEATAMPYLQACIKEALRMHPPIGLMLERYVPERGAELAGYYLPPGTTVGVNAWVVARDERTYGEDADVFRPERWLDCDEERLAAMERASLTFGHGPRSCIGKNISLLEINKLVPQLLRQYQFSFLRSGQRWSIRPGWFVYQDGFKTRISRR